MPHPRLAEPLLFGDSQSAVSTSLQTFSDQIASAFPGLEAYDALPSDDGFLSKMARLQLPSLELVAGIMTPTRVSRRECVNTTLLIPLTGHHRTHVDGGVLSYGATQGCLFLPAGANPMVGYEDQRHLFLLNIDQALLQATARAMRGEYEDEDAAPLDTSHVQVLPMQVAGAPLAGIARHLGALIDLHGLDAQVLHQLGMQDFIYRHLVPLFPHRPAATPRATPRAHKRRAIDRVCSAALADLSRPITLTDMATQAHMSVRALQYTFQERFGLSPLDWLRQQRLALARQRLERGEFTSIALLAQECGLGTASRFAAQYRQQFGQLPSVAAGRRRG
jgi:AraC-like DNA-binding protein